VLLPAGQSDDYATAIAVQEDGTILIAGHVYENAGDFAVIRLERDGKRDASFGEGGKVLTDFDGRGFGTDGGVLVTPMVEATRSERGMAVLLQSDERVPTVRVLPGGSGGGR
jgi:hypothetical protein